MPMPVPGNCVCPCRGCLNGTHQLPKKADDSLKEMHEQYCNV